MRLLEFPHSHYCEKARWALDWKGVAFEPVPIMPGFHVMTVRRHASGTSVPVLLSGDEAVQGSSRIIDYLEETYPDSPLTPEDPGEREECMALERAMDERLGESLRVLLYDWLLDHPRFICYCFTYPMPRAKRWTVRILYPLLRRKIYETYIGSASNTARARRDFDAAMSEVQDMLGGGPYLIGDRFTRADLSVASMLSLLVMPPEHPFPWPEIPDARARRFIDEYRDHSVSRWARDIYRGHRCRTAGGAIDERDPRSGRVRPT